MFNPSHWVAICNGIKPFGKTKSTFFHVFVFCTFLSFTISSFSQQNKIDSLKILLRSDKADTNKVIHSYKLCWEYVKKGLYDSAMHYGNSSLNLAQQLNFKKGIGTAYGNIGNVYYEKGDYPRALDFYSKTLDISEELGDKKDMAKWLGNIGVVFCRQGDYPKSLGYYFRALEISEELGDKKRIAAACNNIGILYKYKNNYPKAINYFFRAKEISEELGDKDGTANNLGNIGTILENQGKYDKALDYYFKSLKIAEQVGNKKIIAASFDNIGNVYTAQKEYTTALDYYFKALKIDEELGNKNGIAIKLGNIGQLYTATKKYAEAEKYLEKSLSIAEEIGNMADVKAGNEYLGELYTKTGKHEKALVHYKNGMIAKDSVYNEEKNNEILRKEMNYEFSKNELAKQAEYDRQITKQETDKKKQQIIIWSVMSGLLLSMIFAGLIFRSLRITKKQKEVIESQKEKVEIQNEEIRKQKHLVEEKNKIIERKNNLVEEKNEELNQQNKEITVQRDKLVENLKYTEKLQETLKNDLSHFMLISLRKLMNPHFIFNSLNSIQSFILQNDKLKASLYLSKFSDLIRRVLEQSQMEYISLNDEINTLSIYIELEEQRFVGRFKSSINIEQGIVPNDYLVPPLIFQPFVENAIWHGLMQKESEGKLSIDIKLTHNSLLCSVEDNGIGREESMKKNKERKTRESFGIKATDQRLKILNSLNNTDMVVKYFDLKDDTGKACGTRVEFVLPCLFNS
ncbi:MAG: tetratricopeptide repeat protein [Bacteroidota bacterium]